MNPILHFYSSLHFHVYFLIWCSSPSSKQPFFFFFFQSDKQFSSCLGKKGLQHRTPHSPALFFKHSTVGYSSSLDESNQKPVFCFSSIAINTSHLQLSSSTRPSSAPTPLLPQCFVTKLHPRPGIGCSNSQPKPPTGAAPPVSPHPHHSPRPVWLDLTNHPGCPTAGRRSFRGTQDPISWRGGQAGWSSDEG